MRLLLLDDDPEDRFLVKRALARSDLAVEVDEVGTVAAAIAALTEKPPDCLLVDYRLPDGTGLDLLAHARCPVILLTGQGDEALAVSAMKAGVADYIPKESITPARLQQAVSAAIEKAELQARVVRYQHDLEARNQELERLNKQKDRFFSIIAHDLRSPFNGLLGISQLMMEGGERLSGEEREQLASAIHQSARDVFALLENLLAWSRLQMHAVRFVPESTLLEHLVRSALGSVRTIAAQKDISVISDVRGLRVAVDRDMIAAVLRNLLDNAVKFTEPGGRVQITAHASDDPAWVEIRVSDTGVGLPPSQIERLFRLDEKVSTPGTAGEPGTGLGLMLCKELVERHGGRITVGSREGHGASFTFSVPAAAE